MTCDITSRSSELKRESSRSTRVRLLDAPEVVMLVCTRGILRRRGFRVEDKEKRPRHSLSHTHTQHMSPYEEPLCCVRCGRVFRRLPGNFEFCGHCRMWVAAVPLTRFQQLEVDRLVFEAQAREAAALHEQQQQERLRRQARRSAHTKGYVPGLHSGLDMRCLLDTWEREGALQHV